MSNIFVLFMIFSSVLFQESPAFPRPRTVHLTLNRAVEIAMANSYRIRQLRLGIERTRNWLKAERAGLKSRVYMNIKSPELNSFSDYKWNSTLQRDEIVRQNTQLWQMELSVKQPVILFGYPTNGYLSLNSQTYKYTQKEADGNSNNFYNRYFVKYEQPFFRPNTLKNDLERAKLNLEENELEYIDDQVDMIEDLADDYYDLFRLAYRCKIYEQRIQALDSIEVIVKRRALQDSTLEIDQIQIQVEMANARERLLQNLSDMRLQSVQMKQKLGLNGQDTLAILPHIKFRKYDIDAQKAIENAYTLRPRMRLLSIEKQRNQINLENTKGWNAFRMELEISYGIERQDESYRHIWNDYDNSNSVSINAYIPLWDWGRRNAQIEAQRINVRKSNLRIEEWRRLIASEITNSVANLQEYQHRTESMKENLEMAEKIFSLSSIKYKKGEISLTDLLQALNRELETELNYLDAYLNYRDALLQLMVQSYFDYENNVNLLDQLRTST